MCQFKSAIVLREPRNKGDFALLHSFASDSHSDLIKLHNLCDDGKVRFARVELVPGGEDWCDLKSYRLKLDEERAPDWWTPDMAEVVADKLLDIVKTMIVPENVKYLLGGAWIVPKGHTVEVGPNTLIVVNYGTVSVNYGTVSVNSGTVSVNSGTVSVNSGTVSVNSGTVSVNYGTVSDNYGTVSVNYGTVSDNYGDVVKNDTTYGKGTITSGRKALT